MCVDQNRYNIFLGHCGSRLVSFRFVCILQPFHFVRTKCFIASTEKIWIIQKILNLIQLHKKKLVMHANCVIIACLFIQLISSLVICCACAFCVWCFQLLFITLKYNIYDMFRVLLTLNNISWGSFIFSQNIFTIPFHVLCLCVICKYIVYLKYRI